MSPAPCPFCARIADHEYEMTTDRDVVSFVPLRPVTPGHRLFLPLIHAPRFDREWTLLGKVAAVAALYAGQYHASNLIVSAGSAATQTVPHFHVHLVPRRPQDGLQLPWTAQQEEAS